MNEQVAEIGKWKKRTKIERRRKGSCGHPLGMYTVGDKCNACKEKSRFEWERR